MNMNTVGWMMATVAVGMALMQGCVSAPNVGDPYFTQVKPTANVYAKQGQSGVLKIAVMPLKAATDLIGSSVSDMVVTELLRTQKYQLVERGQMAKVMSETELAMAGVSEAKAVEAAKLLGAEAVVIGTVDEYGTQTKEGSSFPVVALSIRLIDCATGKIVWSADLAKMSNRVGTPLSTHARDVVHELVASLYQHLIGVVGTLPPAAPVGVSVGEMGLREAVVQWQKPDFPAKYRVERALAQEGPFVSVGDVNATDGRFVDSGGLRDSTVYYYRIVGVGRTGVASEPSAVVETMTAPPPDPPTQVAATVPSSRCIVLTWTPPRSDGVVDYVVERSLSGAGGWKRVGSSATPSFRDGGVKGCDLSDSTVYRYRVLAKNRVGAEGAPSQEVEAKTLPPPAKVSGFRAVADQVRCAPLSWRESPEPDVSGYEIERAEGEGATFGPLAAVGKSGAYEDGKRKEGDLKDGVVYRYRIRAVNPVGGQGEWSDVATALTKPMAKVPTGLATTRDVAGKVSLKWNANAEDFVNGYDVESRSENGWFRSTVAEKTAACAAEDNGLKAGEVRLYRIRALDRYGRVSDWSAEVQGAARPLPDPPRAIRAARVGSGYKITFAPPRDGMTEFRIYRKKFMGSDLVKTVKTCEATIDAPPAGETADIVVTAVDECGLESLQSDSVRIGP